MRVARWTAVLALGVALLAIAPGASAGRTVAGVVTNCRSASSCAFVMNGTGPAGWANGTPPTLAFQFASEAKASYNLTYGTYTARLSGTYTYWTAGNFWGTDVNTGHVVYGMTNTNYTITCHGHSGRGGGCTYTYTTDNGTILFHLTQAEITSTAISCSPASVHAGGKATCTVTVTNGWNVTNVPKGKVTITDGLLGSLSNKGTCALVNGTCTFTLHAPDDACGTIGLTASYLGTRYYYKSQGTTSESVTGGC